MYSETCTSCGSRICSSCGRCPSGQGHDVDCEGPVEEDERVADLGPKLLTDIDLDTLLQECRSMALDLVDTKIMLMLKEELPLEELYSDDYEHFATSRELPLEELYSDDYEHFATSRENVSWRVQLLS